MTDMKRYTLSTLIALAGAFLLAGCTDELLETPRIGVDGIEVPDGYYFILDTDIPQGAAQTRVAYADINHSYFEEDDRLGIYAIDEQGNRITSAPANAEYRVANVTNIQTGNVRQVLENVHPENQMPRGYAYVIYYPYNENMTFERLKDLTHSVLTDQHTAPTTTNGLTPYEQSDLLWDVAQDRTNESGTHYVNIQMDHAMANIILNISEEHLAAGSYEEGYEVYVVNTPNRADGINLTLSLDYQDAEGNPWRYNTSRTSSTFSGIKMWYTGLSTSGDLQFRAAIPACQTIPAGTAFLQIQDPDGTDKQFQLKSDLPLRPGKNYIFTIRQTTPEGSVIPDVTDDDSWVLDVLDPETGEPVGLLCREYLRYQPEPLPSTGEYPAGDETNIPAEPANQCWVNSQAWVFYNLKDRANKIPDLNTGTVLRFLYDVEYHGFDSGFFPAPHERYQQGGMFTPEHGYEWGEWNPEGYGQQISNSFKEYYMNGGTVTWNGTQNKIQSFVKPSEEKRVTCEQAKNGYIAITGKGNDLAAYVSYDPDPDESVRKGILMPHKLVDSRLIKHADGSVTNEVNLYPLVKIGYNQFWMSKSLRATSLTDGTPLLCYNQKGNMDSENEDERKPARLNATQEQILEMGYIYPFDSNVSSSNNTTQNYDPYNDIHEMNVTNYPEETYRPSPLYNKPTVQDERFVPISSFTKRNYYIMPNEQEVENMINYFGLYFAAKMSTRKIATKTSSSDAVDEHFKYYKYEAAVKGELHSAGGTMANYYTANISGLNLRGIGFFEPAGYTYSGLTGSAAYIVKTDNEGVEYFNFPIYAPFDVQSVTEQIHLTNAYFYSPAQVSQFFAQVRMLMKYRNQADTGGISITTSTRSVSGCAPAESRNVYIPIQAID